MKSGRDEAARGSIPGCSPRPDREHRKPQPTTCYTVVCVKTAVEISEESPEFRPDRPVRPGSDVQQQVGAPTSGPQQGMNHLLGGLEIGIPGIVTPRLVHRQAGLQ